MNLPKDRRDIITLLIVLAGVGAMAMTVLTRTSPVSRDQVSLVAAAPAATASAAPPFSEDGNILFDPSFEVDADSDGVGDGWAHFGAAAKFVLEPSARYGAVAQRITMEGVADPIADYGGVQQHVSVKGGESYIVSVDYRHVFSGAPDPSRGVGITVYALTGDGSYIPTATVADWGWPPTESWSRRSIRVRPPVDAVKLVVEFRTSVNGILWLDGAKLERVSGS